MASAAYSDVGAELPKGVAGRDCVIIGGGPTGLLAAIGLAHRGWSVELWERNALKPITGTKSHSPRGWGVFLTTSSLERMKEIVGNAPAALDIPMQEVRGFTLVDATSESSVTLDPEGQASHSNKSPKFGWGIDTLDLRHALLATAESITQTTGRLILKGGMTPREIHQTSQACLAVSSEGHQVRTKCLIVADGRQSQTRLLCGISARVHPFGQSALLVRFSHSIDAAHHGHGFEIYTHGGPAVFLPMPNGTSTLTWVGQPADIEALASLNGHDLMGLISEVMPDWMGKITEIQQKAHRPLIHAATSNPVSGRCVAIGDAANGLHPLFAQGYNLAVRDVAALCHKVGTKAEAHPADPAASLKSYQQSRRLDHLKLQSLTTVANGCLSAPGPIGALSRACVPNALKRSATLRRQAIVTLGST